jgi:polyisoprenoid-binding protein YceI
VILDFSITSLYFSIYLATPAEVILRHNQKKIFMETNNRTKWVIDPSHTEIMFRVKHLVIATVTGRFDVFEGFALTSGENFSGAAVEFSADIDSINTNQKDRDNHLKSPDFFDAANHPKLLFKSHSFEPAGAGQYKMRGDMTIRSTTKPIDLDVTFSGIVSDGYGNTKAGFEITGKLNRKDYGLLWNAVTEAGGVVVGDEVKLIINAELAKS